MIDLSELAQYIVISRFFWWSFHQNLVICMLFGDWEGKVFQNWGLGRSILHPDFRVELPSVWSIFFMLVPSGLVEKACLKKIDMSDYILISRKNIATRDFWEYRKTQSWWISPKKHPKFPVFKGGFTRVFWKIPSTVNFPHAAVPTKKLTSFTSMNQTIDSTYQALALCRRWSSLWRCLQLWDPSVFVEFFWETVRFFRRG